MAVSLEEIITDRLQLRMINVDDNEFIYRLVNTMDWITFIGDRKVASAEAAKTYIERILSTKDFYYWVIRTKDTNTPVGIASFLKRDYLPHWDIGFALLPEYYKRGYALEATTALIEHYKKLGHKTILATVLPTNTRSLRMLQKMGFEHERDMVNNNESLSVLRLDVQ